MIPLRVDLTRVVLAVLCLGLLIALTLWILSPFLPALVWATMVVVSTWPLMRACQQRLWGRRWLAVTVMTLAMLLVFVVPLFLSISTIVDNAGRIADWVQSMSTFQVPPPPNWLEKLPVIGGRASEGWRELAEVGMTGLAPKLQPYASRLVAWFASEVGSFGMMALQFLLTVVLASILYATGETAAGGLTRFARRLAGERGDGVIRLAGQAIRGVALGVVVTAIVQSVFAGIGLKIAGIPFVGILTAIMFMLAVAQIGVGPVLIVAVGWLYWTDATGAATFLLVWSLVAGSMDNFLRPILIKRGADLPLLLIFAGVIGGLVAFGLVGIFVGPVVLAVTYTLLNAWISDDAAATPPSEATPANPVPE